MASPSSATVFTSSGVPQPPVTVSQEEFILFHNIDRKLFSRLVFALGRDPGESAQVVALFMWLEHAGDEPNLVHRICSSLPDTLLNGVADESVVALNCIQSDDFYDSSSPASSVALDIPLIQALTKNGHNLKYFHQNRLGIIRGVSKLLNEVCMRAFDDLMPKLNPLLNYPYNNPYFQTPAAAAAYEIATGTANLGPPPPPAALYPTQTQRIYVAAENPYEQFSGSRQLLMAFASARAPDASLDYLRGVFDRPYDLAAQRQVMNNEMNEMLARLNLNMDDDDQFVVDSADERTIFLTFSKGYPISETEVREFFSRKFGEFIEDVFMQEVPPEEQPLYARLVVRNAAIIPAVLDGQSKAKFSINGKHVWARKYVRKNQKSPSRSPGEPSSPRAGFAPTQF